jgi:hypothetical protein
MSASLVYLLLRQVLQMLTVASTEVVYGGLMSGRVVNVETATA